MLHAPPPTTPTITVLADEMLDADTVRIVSNRGGRVLMVNEIMPGAGDDDVAAFANHHRALVATLNVNDFKRLLSRRSPENVMRYRHASLLGIVCDPVNVGERLAATWDFVLSEWQIAQERPDGRLFLEIGRDYAKTFR